ncbi:MAG: cytochrome b/b6 domain-containing protein [Sutterellaceae bacterium]|nr:cytochrome b/b6 domain-containing protein [Sutterellaceae bacterium]
MTHTASQVLRFHLSDRIFHALHALFWFALMASAMYAGGLRHAGNEVAYETAIGIHLALGAGYVAAFAIYVAVAPDRMARFFKELFRSDRNCFAWFRNFGNYPKRFLGIQIGPKEVAAQGRYNGGQRVTYTLFAVAAFALIVSGIALMGLRETNEVIYQVVAQMHGGIALLTTLVVVIGHIPMALVSPAMRKAIAPWGNGQLSLAVAKEHSPLWVANDLTESPINASLLEEKRLVAPRR